MQRGQVEISVMKPCVRFKKFRQKIVRRTRGRKRSALAFLEWVCWQNQEVV
jgi:hypothetical protein